jgi:hypothetical protein
VRTPRPWTLPDRPVTGTALRAGGISAAMLETQLAHGNLMRLRPNVYAAARTWPASPRDQHILLARAEQVARPSAVISHVSAATVWGLPHPGSGWWWGGPVTLMQEGGPRTSYSGATCYLGRLPANQVALDPAGYRVTTPARTAVDLAARLPLPQALVLLDAAARLTCASFVPSPRRKDFRNPRLIAAARRQLTEAAETVRCRGLERAIALTEPCRESAIESLSAGHFALAGLPTPTFQESIRTPQGEFFPDCYWPYAHLIGEADGASKYADPAAIVKEKEREQYLRDCGYRFVRWLGKEIMARPWEVVARVARALDAAR